jgi:hypothetical protein
MTKLKIVASELDKYIYNIDKEFQYTDDFILCVAPFVICFVLDKISKFCQLFTWLDDKIDEFKLAILSFPYLDSITPSMEFIFYKSYVTLELTVCMQTFYNDIVFWLFEIKLASLLSLIKVRSARRRIQFIPTKMPMIRWKLWRPNWTNIYITDFVCLYTYEFWLSLCKIVRSSVILLLPLFISYTGKIGVKAVPNSVK